MRTNTKEKSNVLEFSKPTTEELTKSTLCFEQLCNELEELYISTNGEISFFADIYTPSTVFQNIYFSRFERYEDGYFKFVADMYHDEESCVNFIFDANQIIFINKNTKESCYWETGEARYGIELKDGYSIIIYIED